MKYELHFATDFPIIRLIPINSFLSAKLSVSTPGSQREQSAWWHVSVIGETFCLNSIIKMINSSSMVSVLEGDKTAKA